jgi:TP901 family phage tail tape measure protein
MADRVVKYVFQGDIRGLQTSLAAAGQSVGKLADDLTKADAQGAKFRAGMTTVGQTAGKMGLVAAGGLALVTKAAMDWESAWAGVQKTVDGSASEMATLEGELRSLATTLPATHAEIAGVAEAAGQLGVQREAVAGFTRTMIDLGETTNLTAEEAATSIARFANIMGTAQTEVDRVGSSLVELGNNSATTEAEILELGTRLAAAGSIAGLTEGDVLGFAAALTSVGVEAEAGGTAMSKVFTSMRDAAIDGGEKLEVFARTAGMTAQEFSTAWAADPAQTIDAFVQGLGRINESGQSTSQVFKALGLTDQRLMRALLSAAEAGELLGDSLDLGNTGFEENTALAIEAAKRYETTAAQTQIAWNSVKDAAIDFGETALPVLAKGADMVADMAQAIGSLPGPVKSATTGLLGITAVLGGGVWFASKAIGGVADMRNALEQVGMSAGSASKAMKGVGTAAAVVAGFTIIQQIQSQVDETLPGLEAMTRQLIDLSSAADSGLSTEFDSLGESIERLTDKNWAQKFDDAVLAVFGSASSMVKEATAEIDLLDTSLATLVSTGNADTAAKSLENLAESQGLSAREVDDLLKLLPQYSEALTAEENAARLAADSADDFSGSVASGSSKIEAYTDALEANIDAMRDQRSEAIRGANAAINYQASLDDARASLKENGRTLDITTEKGRANKTALLGVASAWNDQSAAAKNAPGAHRAAIESFVNLATQMGMGEEKARALARRILELPDKKVKVEADTSQADYALSLIKRDLSELDGRTARTYVTTVYSQAGFQTRGGIQERATGGSIGGQSPHKRADNILIAATAGEYMHQVDAVDYYGLPAMHAINQRRIPKELLAGYAYGGAIGDIPGYAAGGSVAGTANLRVTGDSAAVADLAAATRELAAAQQALAAAEQRSERFESAREQVEAAQATAKSLKSQVASRGDLLRQEQRLRDIRRELNAEERDKDGNLTGRKAVRGLDRRVAQAELAEAQREMARMKRSDDRFEAAAKRRDRLTKDLRRNYQGTAAEARRLERAEERLAAARDAAAEAEAQRQAREEHVASRSQAIQATAGVFGDGFLDLGSVSARMQRAIDNASEFTTLMGQLSAKGTSPFILAQLDQEGPTEGALVFARQLLKDEAGRRALNAQSARLVQVGTSYGRTSLGFSTGWSEQQIAHIARDAAVYAPVTVNAPQNMSPQQVGDATAQRIVSKLAGRV